MRAGELTFGEALRFAREAKGWPLRRAARATGLSFAVLGRIERNEQAPGAEALAAIVSVFGTDLPCPTCGRHL